MNRSPAIDALRGLMLVLMAIAHSGSRVAYFTWHSLGFFDAAAGFFFLSGLVAGLGYAGLDDGGARARDRRVWRRALQVWAAHLLLAALMLGAFAVFRPQLSGLWPWRDLLRDPVWLALLKYASLLWQTSFFDILPMYCVFLALTPWIVRAVRRGWGGAVLAAGAALWLAAQFGYGSRWAIQAATGFVPRYGMFEPSAWQLLFLLGLVLGVLRPSRGSLRPGLRRSVVAVCALAGLAMFLAYHLPNWWRDPATAPLLSLRGWAAKSPLGVLFLLDFLVVAVLVWQAALRWPRAFAWRGLALLGRHSLSVFTFHIALTFMLAIFVRHVDALAWPGQLLYTAGVVGALAVPALASAAWSRRRREVGAPTGIRTRV